MRKITLHRASIDNAGHYRDAGATLTIAEGSKEDTISADRASDLLDSNGAAPVSASTRDPLDHDGDGRKGGSVKASG